VDDLFARIRAGRKSAVTNARQVLQSDSSTGTADPEVAASDVGASDVAPSQIGDPVIDVDGELAAVDGEAVDGEVIDVDLEVVDIVAADAADDDEEPQHSDEEEAWLQRRDAALADIETSLTRKLKRALQDEQNDLLDRLRSLRGRPNASGLLVTDVEQKQRFSSAASTLVEQAAKEGVTFAVTLLGEQGVKAPQPRSATEFGDLVDSLAESIVDPLRRRLEQTIADFADDEQVVLVEALGAAYREWKTQRIEQIAGDVLTAAFARGTVHATPKAARLRWLADDVTGPCSDCDDNVLEGPLPKSEAFPTGQIHPPAHTGCRCILIPGPA